MTKSKNRKNHKQKVAARNQRIKDAKRRSQKFYTEQFIKMLEQEKEKGLYDNLEDADIEIRSSSETVSESVGESVSESVKIIEESTDVNSN